MTAGLPLFEVVGPVHQGVAVSCSLFGEYVTIVAATPAIAEAIAEYLAPDVSPRLPARKVLVGGVPWTQQRRKVIV